MQSTLKTIRVNLCCDFDTFVKWTKDFIFLNFLTIKWKRCIDTKYQRVKETITKSSLKLALSLQHSNFDSTNGCILEYWKYWNVIKIVFTFFVIGIFTYKTKSNKNISPEFSWSTNFFCRKVSDKLLRHNYYGNLLFKHRSKIIWLNKK